MKRVPKAVMTGITFLVGVVFFVGCGEAQTAAPEQALTEEQTVVYSVELAEVSSDTLRASFASDPQYSEYAPLVSDVFLDINDEGKKVDIIIESSTSDTQEACRLGEAIARCLSDRAKVVDQGGGAAPDDGPCGALYEAYDLSVRVVGISDANVWDGWLPASSDSMMWQ